MDIPSKLFVDTSYFIALLNKEDDDHAQALALQAQLASQTVHKYTSEYVLLELGDGLSRLRFRHLAVQLIDLVYSDTTLKLCPLPLIVSLKLIPYSNIGLIKSGA